MTLEVLKLVKNIRLRLQFSTSSETHNAFNMKVHKEDEVAAELFCRPELRTALYVSPLPRKREHQKNNAT